MRRICSWILIIALLLGLCACRQNVETQWREQYDLGVRYLSEGNYEEAIIAFSAAIEIDPKRPEAYLGAAETYIAKDDIEAARKVLEDGLEVTGNQSIADKLQEILDSSGFDINVLLMAALQKDTVLSYTNIPELFSKEYDNLASFFGLPLCSQDETTFSGNFNGNNFSFEVNECLYEEDCGSTIKGRSIAALNNREIIDADMSTYFEEDWGTPTGWLDICLGDDYGTVLRKLGMDESLVDKLMDYKGIWIELYKDGNKRGYALEQSGTTVGGQPLPQIYIDFFDETLDEEKTVWMEFFDGSHLNRILYSNQSLFTAIVGAQTMIGD